MKKIYILFTKTILFFIGVAYFLKAQEFPNGEIAAKVNGEIITQKQLYKTLVKCYGKDIADSLNMNVIRAVLEEMIIFKIIEQHIRKYKVKCSVKDYLEDVKEYEKPFLNYYFNWGIKNSITFLKFIYRVIKKDKNMLAKYGSLIKRMGERYRLSKGEKELLKAIWKEMLKKKHLKKYIRKQVFEKYHVSYDVFKTKIKIMTKFRKWVRSKITKKELNNFIKKEKFALKGGIVKLYHILLLTIDEDTNKPLPLSQQKIVLKKILKLKNKIKDLKTFKKIAQLYSDDEITRFKGGKIGWVPRWNTFRIYGGFLYHVGWLPHWTAFIGEVIAKAYHMPKNKISQPIKSKLGYHIIIVTDKKKGKNITQKELRKIALKRLEFIKMEEYLKKWLKEGKIERYI